MTNDFTTCYVCGGRATEVHHVLHGASKGISEQYGLMVPLCRNCHNKVHHVGGELDRQLKEDAQRILLIDICGRCYL